MIAALQITNYALGYRTRRGLAPALRGIDLAIAPGETLGLVGASGSGKTSLAWAILRLLPGNAEENGGGIALGADDLRAMRASRLARLRGRRIGMVFQDPSTSLNPAMRLGDQVIEVMRRHQGVTRQDATRRAEALLDRTGLRDPRAIMRRFPHEVSGGEKQRVVIATAFACRPELILFDEPTTALDVVTAAQILALFAELQAEMPVAALYISHDLGLVGRIADRVAVLDAGAIVEQGTASEVLRAPRSEAARRLLDSVPDPAHRLAGPSPETATLLEVRRVSVIYGRPGALGRLLGAPPAVTAAHDIGFSLRAGETLGIVGESGSGKSTLARALTGIAAFTGTVRFAGRDRVGGRPMVASWRRDVQIIFQNPDASLNPRHRVATILGRPLRLHREMDRARISTATIGMLDEVGLPPDYADRYPHELSGGEKQRVAIARAFAASPRLVICDEVTSALDMVVQADIVRLLLALQARHGTACLFITHDLNLVRQMAHRILVMYRGAAVDQFDAASFQSADRHCYTRQLLAAIMAF
jgi:peptide/nickel transport system ATP-binding protein